MMSMVWKFVQAITFYVVTSCKLLNEYSHEHPDSKAGIAKTAFFSLKFTMKISSQNKTTC